MVKKRFMLWGVRAPREVASGALGSLERQVMDVVWRRSPVSVRDVHAELGLLAYTTLMTTLDRLYKKGLLDRQRQGRAFIYSASASREELGRAAAADLIDGLLHQSPGAAQPLLSSLVDVVSARDRQLLDELERLVRDKRRRLLRRGQE